MRNVSYCLLPIKPQILNHGGNSIIYWIGSLSKEEHGRKLRALIKGKIIIWLDVPLDTSKSCKIEG